MAKGCKDCEPGSKRPTPHPGPRCATHHRAFKRQQKANNHDRMVVKVYGIEPGEYERMYKEQGGVCFICRRANGRTKRLAVDHDHDTGLVRGLLCGPCNKFVGYVRNSADAFRRGAAYLDWAEIKNGATSAA
jgi:hypothetical protein